MQDNPFTKDVPIITQLKTNDADELAEFIRGWDQEHIQLTKGTFEWETCILNDLAINYAQLGKIDKAISILDQSLSIAQSFDDLAPAWEAPLCM